MAGLKDKVTEFADIAKSLPENLQVTCFQLLLQHHLEGSKVHEPKRIADKPQNTPEDPKAEVKPADAASSVTPADTSKQKDFKIAALPIKAKRFLADNSVTIEEKAIFSSKRMARSSPYTTT